MLELQMVIGDVFTESARYTLNIDEKQQIFNGETNVKNGRFKGNVTAK